MQCGENRKGKSCNLNGAADDVRDEKHEHADLFGISGVRSLWAAFHGACICAYLPSPSLVSRSGDMSVFLYELLVLKQMRLALVRQSNTLHAS